MPELDFRLFDADNHYYEATDAFTRHLDPAFRKRGVQWAEVEGRHRLLVAGRINRFIPNPTFDPVARPGVLDDYFRGKTPGDDIRAAFGELEPISPAYREADARLELMDQQGIEGCFLFPTLGVGMEEALCGDPEAAHASFSAFNRWLEDDWGYAHQDRIFAAPYVCLLDPELAEAEVARVLEHGARVVVMRSGPVKHPLGHRSHGDPVHDGVWQRLDEAGVLVAFHSGESGYGFLVEGWGRDSEFEAFRHDAFKQIITGHRPIHDTIAGLICDGVFTRFPRVRVATIESGSDWVAPLARSLGKAFKQRPSSFDGVDPVEQLRAHVWVSPYYEDDIRGVADVLGADHVLFGSDYPHAEGLADPASFVHDLEGFSDDEIRLIMRENALGLVQPARVPA
jgi:predicted TIM-barrel fold metal-dependent hydrolase